MSEGTAGVARPILDRAEQADGNSPVSDQALLAAGQGQRALLVFTEAEGAAPVAVGIVGQGELDLVVDPASRGKGIGTAALRILLDTPAAREPAPGGSTGPLAWAHGDNPTAEALLRGAGFEAVRSLYRMALDPALLPALPADPFDTPLPAGFELRTFDAAAPDDDARAWVRVNARAFASHPEQGRVTLEDFALMRAEPWFDPADLFLLRAADTGRTAGFTWVKTLRDGAAPETELYVIGVDPDFAGAGLGRALLTVTLARMAQHRPGRVTLYVDGDNARAVRMYEAAGFTIDSRSTQWRGPQVSE
ncbi:mycothiol synthase [Leucobacter komagatae]|uniref:mycothiol synthase n=1 Tax=Leucobacter komagatae TaxID=55969 RepID=UPI001FE9D0A5|nr:mycothiol synthase [Leucobacter komagatae]